MRRIVFIFFLISTTAVLLCPVLTSAQEPTEPLQIRAEVITKESQTVFLSASDDGKTYRFDTKESYPDGLHYVLKKGDPVLLRLVAEPDGNIHVYFEDKIRTPALLWIIVFFAVVSVLIASRRGLFALGGVLFTIVVLFGLLFPALLSGKDPVLSTVGVSLLILAVNLHLSHGFRKRTFFAFLGTVSGLLLVTFFSFIFTKVSYLSGIGTEEVSLLLWDVKQMKDPVGLFIAGVILGAVGVLDDIAVAQAELVEELQTSDPKLSRKALFLRAMRVGRHHIASTVNTLVLVYAGAALPLMLLYFSSFRDPFLFLNNESVADEMIRILAGTTALILTVPLATAFAVIPKKTIDNTLDDR